MKMPKLSTGAKRAMSSAKKSVDKLFGGNKNNRGQKVSERKLANDIPKTPKAVVKKARGLVGRSTPLGKQLRTSKTFADTVKNKSAVARKLMGAGLMHFRDSWTGGIQKTQKGLPRSRLGNK